MKNVYTVCWCKPWISRKWIELILSCIGVVVIAEGYDEYEEEDGATAFSHLGGHSEYGSSYYGDYSDDNEDDDDEDYDDSQEESEEEIEDLRKEVKDLMKDNNEHKWHDMYLSSEHQIKYKTISLSTLFY